MVGTLQCQHSNSMNEKHRTRYISITRPFNDYKKLTPHLLMNYRWYPFRLLLSNIIGNDQFVVRDDVATQYDRARRVCCSNVM